MLLLGLAALGLATAAAAPAPPAGVVRPSPDGGQGAEPATFALSDGDGQAMADDGPGMADDGPATADAGRATVAPGPGAGPTSYVWPTGAPADVLRRFDPPAAPWASGHRGVDLEIAAGAPVLAAAEGVVVFAGTVVDRPVVSLEHADGIRTTYEPVRPTVRPGQRVAAGETIGHVEGLHCVVLPPAACLHLGARTGPETYVDPLRLLGADVVIRLLPERADGAG